MQDRALHRRVWHIAWPMMVSNISIPLLGLVDTALLGHLQSALYLGAVAIGMSIITMFYWAFSFLRMGTTLFTAQHTGGLRRGDNDIALSLARIMAQSCVLGILCGGSLLALGPLFSGNLLLWMGADTAVLDLAEEYIAIRLVAAPAVFITYAITGWLIGSQQTRWALVLVLITNCLNIVLDIVFILGLELNSAGAAWATVTAEFVGAALGLLLLCKNLPMQKLKFARTLTLDKRLRELLGANSFLMIRTLLLLACFTFFTAQSARMGENTLAANTILLQLVFVSAYVMDGFANSAEALCGAAIGQKQLLQFRQSVHANGIWIGTTGMIIGIIYTVFGANFIAALTHFEEVTVIASSYLGWVCIMPVISACSYLLDGVFIGAARSRYMLYSMLFASVAVYFPVWWLSRSLGNTGLWIAFIAFNLARSISLILFYRYLDKRDDWLNSAVMTSV